MLVQQNISLRNYNTFGINARAKAFIAVSTGDELYEALAFQHRQTGPLLILGGGSNLLLTQDFPGLVLRNELKGIELVKEDTKYYYVRSAAGENWHQFVLFCLERDYGGAENLSLIPGNVGASPMQNIGAYGVEIKDIFHELEAVHLHDRVIKNFNLDECKFGYRDSIFKGKYRNQFIITGVTFRLLKTPQLNTSYGAIEQELECMMVTAPTIQSVSQAVINIRKSKLPDPAVIGNAGSFFKNPTIPTAQYQALQETFPGIIGYSAGNSVKLAAGWLIEQCGWKGYRRGDVGCHDKQALVLVNYGQAQGIDVLSLSTEIMHSVEQKFGVLLEREVNIV